MFFTLFIVSFFFISDLISGITSIKYVKIEIPVIESFQGILNENLTVIYPYDKIRLNLLKKHVQDIVQNVSKITRLKQENETYSHGKIAIFIEDDAQKILIRNDNLLDGIKYEMSNLIAYQSYYVVSFPYNSPLRNKFVDFHTRILEAGLDVKWRSDYEHANKISRRTTDDLLEDEEDTLPLVLIWFMILGTIFSSIGLLF